MPSIWKLQVHSVRANDFDELHHPTERNAEERDEGYTMDDAVASLLDFLDTTNTFVDNMDSDPIEDFITSMSEWVSSFLTAHQDN